MGLLSGALVLVAPLAALVCVDALAQGATTAGISGVVLGADSVGIGNATVTVTNTANGERWQTVTGGRGRYLVEYLSLGGPYSIEARAIGFRPTVRDGITLSLGQRYRADFILTPTIPQLAEVVVSTPGDPRLNSGRTGPAQTIDEKLVSSLPTPHRDFSRLILLSPQAVLTRDSGVSIAGQSDRLNDFQVDGTSNVDLGGIHGLSGVGTAGSSTGLRTLSVEAVRELQILVAPFDVRYGNFAGGLVNAVTRSGSNRWEGSLSGYFQNEHLTGRDSDGNQAAPFTTKELTATLGGPIVRDRMSFFLNVGLQRLMGLRPVSIGADTTGGADSLELGFRRATAIRFQDILRNTYHVEPGQIEQITPETPAGNAFVKVTISPALNQRIELSHNYASATPRNAGGSSGDFYGLSSRGTEESSTVNASRLTWTMAGVGRLANELTIGRLASETRCQPSASYPGVDVFVSADPQRTLSAGSTNLCSRFASQTTWELTDNVSWTTGAHHLTLGTHGELIHLSGSRRVRIPAGSWEFQSLEALEAGIASRYIHDIAPAFKSDGPGSDFRVRQVGFYLQDQWTATPRLTLTAGLRFDVPSLPDTPAQNLELLDSLGVNTAVTPSGNLLWSPRLGFNYDVGGRGRAFLRGGVGLFAGRPIYLYFSNTFESTLRLVCEEEGDVPAVTLDPALQPRSCVSTPALVDELTYFNPSFKFPRNLRLSLGTDFALPWDLVGTVDLLFIRGVDQLDVIDVNLEPPTAVSAGEAGRVLYGSIDPATGGATPNRKSGGFRVVDEMRNASGDRSVSASAQLQKRFRKGAEVSLAYTYTDARDRMSANCFFVTCNIDFTPLDGTLRDRQVSTSRFEATHKITLGAVVNLPLRLQLGVFYNGYSGQPFTYMITGDANASGRSSPVFEGDDIVYVPRDAGDITLSDPESWGVLDSVIRSESCLSSQRGTIMRRNSCRNHWESLLNARLSEVVPLGHGQSVELIADLFNVPNMLDRDWGVQRAGSLAGDVQLLELRGYDEANRRGRYDVIVPDRSARDEEATRWRVQLGARYTF
jgi:Carboxypeptidase regulatory-like domain/TonB dependent receptor